MTNPSSSLAHVRPPPRTRTPPRRARHSRCRAPSLRATEGRDAVYLIGGCPYALRPGGSVHRACRTTRLRNRDVRPENTRGVGRSDPSEAAPPQFDLRGFLGDDPHNRMSAPQVLI